MKYNIINITMSNMINGKNTFACRIYFTLFFTFIFTTPNHMFLIVTCPMLIDSKIISI